MEFENDEAATHNDDSPLSRYANSLVGSPLSPTDSEWGRVRTESLKR